MLSIAVIQFELNNLNSKMGMRDVLGKGVVAPKSFYGIRVFRDPYKTYRFFTK